MEYFYSTGNYNVGSCQVHIYVGCVSVNRCVCAGDTRDVLNKLSFVCIIKFIPCGFPIKQHPFSLSGYHVKGLFEFSCCDVSKQTPIRSCCLEIVRKIRMWK